MSSRITFSHLIAPHDPAEFFRDTYEEKHLHVERANADYYRSALTIDLLEDYLLNELLPASEITISKAGFDVPRAVWTRPRTDYADNHKLLSLLSSGHSIIAYTADKAISELRRFRQGLESELQMQLWCNVYITPANSRAFDRHFDDHDVFIMQVHGAKKWRLYGSPLKLPTEHADGPRPSAEPKAEPQVELTLRSGDLLYLPRGEYHDAVTADDEPSIHITLGIRPVYVYELLEEFAFIAVSQNLGARRATPVELAGAAGNDRFLADFKQLRQLLSTIDVDELLWRRKRRLLERLNPIAGGLEAKMRARDLRLSTVLQMQQGITVLTHESDDRITVTWPGKTLTYPKFMGQALSKPLSGEPFAIGDIAGLIDDRGKIELVDTLVSAGLLVVRR